MLRQRQARTPVLRVLRDEALAQLDEPVGRTDGGIGTLETLFEALPNNPHGLAIHEQVWQTISALGLEPPLVRRYMSLTSDAVFYLDPHVCTRCRYRSTELLWQCPQCHEWNTFVEERLSPAKDSPTAELEPTES